MTELFPVHGSHSLRHLGLGLHLEVGPALGQDAQLRIEVVGAAVLGFPSLVVSGQLRVRTQAVTSLDLVEGLQVELAQLLLGLQFDLQASLSGLKVCTPQAQGFVGHLLLVTDGLYSILGIGDGRLVGLAQLVQFLILVGGQAALALAGLLVNLGHAIVEFLRRIEQLGVQLLHSVRLVVVADLRLWHGGQPGQQAVDLSGIAQPAGDGSRFLSLLTFDGDRSDA